MIGHRTDFIREAAYISSVMNNINLFCIIYVTEYVYGDDPL